MPTFRIVTIVRGTNTYDVQAETKSEAEDAMYKWLDGELGQPVTWSGEDMDVESIHSVEQV